jgi:hypothetical protein
MNHPGNSKPQSNSSPSFPPAEKQTEPYVLPQTVLDAVVILGAAGQAAIRRSGSARYRAMERAA